MAFGVLGFSLVVLAAKSNVPLAAVPVINTNVHFCAAVLTEKQAGQRVDFPVPVGASDGCVFQNPLYGFKIAAADNRLMHIFCDVPLAPVYIVVMFIPEMLCSLEVDYIAAILLPCEDIGQGGFVPLAAVILVERLIFTGSPPSVFHVESGGWDLLLCQIYGDLVAVLPADKQTENQTDNLGGFLVDYPKILVVRVFDIAVRGFGDNRLSTHAFGLNARFHFLADVLCVPLRHDVDKGRKLQCVGLLAVYAVVDRDKAHIVPSEYLHSVADLEIVAPPAGKVFHNADTDFPVFHIVHHAGVGGTVKKPAAFVIVDVVPDIGQVLPSGIVLQKYFLVLYAVALAAVPVLVAHGKAGVKGCNFAIISHVHNLLCVHVCVIYT